MKKKSTGGRIFGVIIFLLIAVLAAVFVWMGMYLKEQSQTETFFANTTINGVDASGRTPEEVMAVLTSGYGDSTVSIYEAEEEALTGTLAEYGYEVDFDTLQASLEDKLRKQSTDLMTLVESLIGGNTFSVEIPFSFDEDTLKAKVTAANLAAERVVSEDAYIKYKKKKNSYVIVPEVYGTEFKDEDLQGLVEEKINGFISTGKPGSALTVDFPSEFYLKPAITADNETLVTNCSIMDSYCKTKITYQFGTQTQVLDWSTIQKWLSIRDGMAVLDEEAMYNYVVSLQAEYETIHHDRKFHTSTGADIVIPASENDYGYSIYEDGEYSQLYSDITSNQVVTREPVYVKTMSEYGNPIYYQREGKDDLAGTYVEVNLTTQHLWFYKNHELIVDTPIVSGCVAKKTETKTGAFPLAYKQSPSVLKGGDAADGYETEVKYWMPFYEGQGMHDADWRHDFGGNIYINSGSHGCVNCPPAAAEKIYQNIEAGVAIILYK
ncbi:MAG: L,D-transpeptidase [Lachnospiraceae bacterium]|nr:L,D-transpeptidase [Lachnospiraceae bacterium]